MNNHQKIQEEINVLKKNYQKAMKLIQSNKLEESAIYFNLIASSSGELNSILKKGTI